MLEFVLLWITLRCNLFQWFLSTLIYCIQVSRAQLYDSVAAFTSWNAKTYFIYLTLSEVLNFVDCIRNMMLKNSHPLQQWTQNSSIPSLHFEEIKWFLLNRNCDSWFLRICKSEDSRSTWVGSWKWKPGFSLKCLTFCWVSLAWR